MSIKDFHVSEDGLIRECTARKEPCQLEHYASVEEAEKGIQEQMDGETLSTLTKDQSPGAVSGSESIVGTTGSVDEGVSSEAVGDRISADNSYQYAIFQLQSGFLHNGAGVGEPPELFYYSSPAGRLELERRVKQSSKTDMVYREIQQAIDEEGFQPEPLDVDMESFDAAAEVGKKRMQEGFSGLMQGKETFYKDRKEVGAYLIQKSHQWVSNLTSEEQDAIAYNTSSGSFLAAYSVGVGGDSVSGIVGATSKNLVGEDETIEEFAEKHKQRLLSACAKAPLFEEPVDVYRGATKLPLT